MWYVMQTITGKEQELVDMIDYVLKKKGYRSCFVIYQECVWRIEGAYKTYEKPMFPSYVFADTDTPEEFFFALRRIPRLSKLLGNDGTFWTVKEEEQMLYCRMLEESRKIERAGSRREDGGDFVAAEKFLIRRSLVTVDEDGNILTAEGPLKEFLGRIVKKALRKRSVVIEIPFLGEKKRILLGIRVEGEEKNQR